MDSGGCWSRAGALRTPPRWPGRDLKPEATYTHASALPHPVGCTYPGAADGLVSSFESTIIILFWRRCCLAITGYCRTNVILNFRSS